MSLRTRVILVISGFILSWGGFLTAFYPWDEIPLISLLLLGGAWGMIFFSLFRRIGEQGSESESE